MYVMYAGTQDKGVSLDRKTAGGYSVEGWDRKERSFLPYRRRYSWVACNEDTDPW